MLCYNYYLSIWFQAVQGVDALTSGIRTLPFILALVAASIVSASNSSTPASPSRLRQRVRLAGLIDKEIAPARCSLRARDAQRREIALNARCFQIVPGKQQHHF